MTVQELIKELKEMPQDCEVEVVRRLDLPSEPEVFLDEYENVVKL